MQVSTINIKWAPAPVPEEVGSNIDWLKASGQLLKSGVVVAELPEVIITIEDGPDATRPSMVTLWTADPAVSADTLKLNLYDAEYQHTVVLGDFETVLADARHGEWVTYSIELPLAVGEDIPSLVTTAIVVGFMGIMMAGVTKV